MSLPRIGDVDPDTSPVPLSAGAQGRAALSFSPVDVARGFRLIDAAEADCERSHAAERLDDIVAEGGEYGYRGALRAQIAFLDGNVAQIDELLADAERRLDRQRTTAIELDVLRIGRLRVLRKQSAARAQLAVLDAAAPVGGAAVPLGAELARYERAAIELETERSRLRQLSSWDVKLKLGAVVADQTEWFGQLSLTYDLGRFWQTGAEREVIAARRDELRRSRMELRDRVTRFSEGMRRSAGALRDELRLVQDELETTRRRLDSLRHVESDDTRDQIATTEIERIDLESDLVFLRRLLAEREAVGNEARP